MHLPKPPMLLLLLLLNVAVIMAGQTIEDVLPVYVCLYCCRCVALLTCLGVTMPAGTQAGYDICHIRSHLKVLPAQLPGICAGHCSYHDLLQADMCLPFDAHDTC